VRTVRYVFGTILGIGLIAGMSTQARAQGLVFGVRGGASVATASIDISQTFETSNRTGFVGGAFFDYGAGTLGLQVGAQYTQMGVDLDLGAAVNEFSVRYLEIPAVLKVGIPLVVVKPSIFGGAALGFNTQCETDGVDCGDNVKSTEFSGIAGADLAMYLGAISLWVDGRYHFGLNNISHVGAIVGDLKNRAWTFQAGLGFKLGG